MKRPVNQLTRMRDAAELARLIEQETSNPPTMDEEKRLVKLAHKHYCTLSEIKVQYKLSTTEDEAISKIYLTLADSDAAYAKIHLSTAYGKLTTKKEI